MIIRGITKIFFMKRRHWIWRGGNRWSKSSMVTPVLSPGLVGHGHVTQFNDTWWNILEDFWERFSCSWGKGRNGPYSSCQFVMAQRAVSILLWTWGWSKQVTRQLQENHRQMKLEPWDPTSEVHLTAGLQLCNIVNSFMYEPGLNQVFSHLQLKAAEESCLIEMRLEGKIRGKQCSTEKA